MKESFSLTQKFREKKWIPENTVQKEDVRNGNVAGKIQT